MKYFIAGNWKMNTNRSEAIRLANDVVHHCGKEDSVDIAVCPPFVNLDPVFSVVHGSVVKLGAQNMHEQEGGAFTGEVSAAMLLAAGCQYVILGHSERRQYFGESDDGVNAKTKVAIAKKLVPIVCVGETLAERDSGRAEVVVRKQIDSACRDVDIESAAQLVIAYEPVWAIGTGRTATPSQAQVMHATIRDLLRKHFGEYARDIRILYGGSMKPENAAELLREDDVNGGLIGGASLVAEKFAAIIAAARAQP